MKLFLILTLLCAGCAKQTTRPEETGIYGFYFNGDQSVMIHFQENGVAEVNSENCRQTTSYENDKFPGIVSLANAHCVPASKVDAQGSQCLSFVFNDSLTHRFCKPNGN